MTFKLDMTSLLARARRHMGDVTINLPFISFGVSPDDQERRVAREVVIRLKDRRVLSAWECCDNCIDNALASLQEIRRSSWTSRSRSRTVLCSSSSTACR